MKLKELYNQSKLKEWTDYDLYVNLNGIKIPLEQYSKDTHCKRIILHMGLPRPRRKKEKR